MLIKALASIEGSRKSRNPVIAPNSVFEADDNTAKRLLGMGAAREATKEDVALAKVHGLLLEADDAAEQSSAPSKPAPRGKAETKAETKVETKAETKVEGKTEDPL